MAIKSEEVARGVRVKLNKNFEPRNLSAEYLLQEKVLFIESSKTYNDPDGEYVLVRGGSLLNSGMVYLNELDLQFPVPTSPLYKI